MTSTVVKQRINVNIPGLNGGSNTADYAGTVNSDGAPHGCGSYKVVEGKHKGSTYYGTFVNGKHDGFGKFTSSGDVYVGEWKADMYNGFGQVCGCFVCLILIV
jgi:hypothetical protein